LMFNPSYVKEVSRSLTASKIPIPHSLYGEHTNICLIVCVKNTPVCKELKRLTRVKIITHEDFNKKYMTFEAQRKLADGYDIIFSERKALKLIKVGKVYIKRKKIPIGINIGKTAKGIKASIEFNKSHTLWYPSPAVFDIKVGRTDFSVEDAIENAVAVVNHVLTRYPIDQLESILLKTSKSIGLPVYSKPYSFLKKTVGYEKLRKEVGNGFIQGDENDLMQEGEDINDVDEEITIKGKINIAPIMTVEGDEDRIKEEEEEENRIKKEEEAKQVEISLPNKRRKVETQNIKKESLKSNNKQKKSKKINQKAKSKQPLPQKTNGKRKQNGGNPPNAKKVKKN